MALFKIFWLFGGDVFVRWKYQIHPASSLVFVSAATTLDELRPATCNRGAEVGFLLPRSSCLIDGENYKWWDITVGGRLQSLKIWGVNISPVGEFDPRKDNYVPEGGFTQTVTYPVPNWLSVVTGQSPNIWANASY